MSPDLNYLLRLQTIASNYLFGLIFTDDTKRVDEGEQIKKADTRLWLIGIVVIRLFAVRLLSKVLWREWPWKMVKESTESTDRPSGTRYLINAL